MRELHAAPRRAIVAGEDLSPTADTSVAAVFWTGKRKRFYAMLAVAGLIYVAASSVADWRDSHTFLINTSPSLPNWAFILDTAHPPVRGALIFFDPPPSALVRAHFGMHPAAFGKRVYGVAGDVVSRVGRTFSVNGHEVGVAKPVSMRGEPLALGPTGVVPRGCFFVGSPHKDGFDSRYAAIGWPCMNRVFGTGTAIL